MNWEGFKTLLLTVLVLLSLVLTWNLWTFETDNHQIEQSKFVSTAISESGKVPIGKVVHPDQAILHQKDGSLSGLGTGMGLYHMFKAIMGAKFPSMEIYGQNPAVRKSKTNIKEPVDSDSIELIFPKAIPVSLFGTILQGNGEGQSDKRTVFTSDVDFDRIVFYKDTQEQATKLLAYFKNGKDPIGLARVSNVSFADLRSFYKNNKEDVIKRDGLYLPAKPKLEKLQYFFTGTGTWIGVDKFKRALFDNPNVPVEQQRNYFVSPWETLQVKDHILQFSDSEPGVSQMNQNSPSGKILPIIEKSFNYVDTHSGWTDSYMLFDYKRDENKKSNPRESVVYRLMVGSDQRKYPVFGKRPTQYPLYKDSGTIMIILKKGSVYKYTRSLLNLDEGSALQSPVDPLPTGEEIWNELKTSKNVKMSLVKKVCVGYQKELKSDEVIFTPKWFVLYQDSWKTVGQLTSAKNAAHGEVSQ